MAYRGSRTALLLIALVLSIPGVSACGSTSYSKAPKVVFPITAEEADKVMYDAMVEEFGVASIHRVTYPQPGYRYAETTIKRIDKKGRTRDGEVVKGYAFQTVGHRSQAVAKNVGELARSFAEALPLAD